MGWDGGWLDGLQAQKKMEGSRGASAECVRVHKLSQSQNNNNSGMERAGEEGGPRERMSTGPGGGNHRGSTPGVAVKMGEEIKNQMRHSCQTFG